MFRPSGAKANGGDGVVNINNSVGHILINRWIGRSYSQSYHEILKKTLPAWYQKEGFLPVLHANQTIVFVGETRSGKTTQIPQFVLVSVEIETPDKHRKMMIGCSMHSAS